MICIVGEANGRELGQGPSGLKRVEAGSSRAADVFLLSPHGRFLDAMIGQQPGFSDKVILEGPRMGGGVENNTRFD